MNYFALAQPFRAPVCEAWGARFSCSKQASHNAADGRSEGLPEGFGADWAHYGVARPLFRITKRRSSRLVLHPIRPKRKGEIVHNRLQDYGR